MILTEKLFLWAYGYEGWEEVSLEATPDMTTQMKALKEFSLDGSSETPDGIFLSHAHIGHYTGLMYLGKEAMNAHKVPVYAMPRMSFFWKQTVHGVSWLPTIIL